MAARPAAKSRARAGRSLCSRTRAAKTDGLKTSRFMQSPGSAGVVQQGFSETVRCKANCSSMEIALANLPTICRLNGASIGRIKLCKRRDLSGRGFDGSFHDEPADALLAGGNGERAVEHIIILIGGQQVGSVDDHLFQFYFFSCFARNVAPQVAQHGVFGAALDEDGDHGGAAGRSVHVDEMQLHVVLLAVDFVFADMVKMELHQRQRGSVDGDAAARVGVDLDGVAVVDYFERRKFVVEMDGSQFRSLRADDINGGLALAGLTSSKIRRKVAPVIGAFRSAIAPVGSIGRMVLGNRGTRKRERGAEKEKSCCGAGQTSRHRKPPGEEGKVASHFAGESSNIRCGKRGTRGYIRSGRAGVKARAEKAFSERREKRCGGTEAYENGTERRAPDWYFLQRSAKRGRARCGTGCERPAERRRAATGRFGRFEIAQRRGDSRFSPRLPHFRATQCGKVERDLVADLAGRQDARAGAIHRAR